MTGTGSALIVSHAPGTAAAQLRRRGPSGEAQQVHRARGCMPCSLTLWGGYVPRLDIELEQQRALRRNKLGPREPDRELHHLRPALGLPHPLVHLLGDRSDGAFRLLQRLPRKSAPFRGIGGGVEGAFERRALLTGYRRCVCANGTKVGVSVCAGACLGLRSRA